MKNQIRVTILSAFVTLSATAAFAQGPIGWWKLDDTTGTVAVDASGNGNMGTVNGAVQINVPGTLAGAFRFANGEVRVPYGSGTLAPATTNVTVSAWINPSGYLCNGFGQCGVVSSEGIFGDGTNGFGLRVIDNGNTLQFCWGTEAYSGTCTYAAHAFQTGVWTHIAGTYDGTTFRNYVNGVEIGQQAVAMAPLNTTRDLVIGALPSGNLSFEGAIDDVRVYGRTLSAAEVSDLATIAPAGATGPQGPQGNTGAQGPQGPVGPQGEGLMTGSFLMLPAGTPAPSGYALVGTFDLQPSGANRGRGTQVQVDVYQRQ